MYGPAQLGEFTSRVLHTLKNTVYVNSESRFGEHNNFMWHVLV